MDKRSLDNRAVTSAHSCRTTAADRTMCPPTASPSYWALCGRSSHEQRSLLWSVRIRAYTS